MKLPERVTNPQIFAENRLNAHSDHRIYASEAEYLKGKSSFYHSLNGMWKFAYAMNPNLALEGFEKMDSVCERSCF